MMEGDSYWCFILFLRVFKPIEEGGKGLISSPKKYNKI